MKVIRQWETPPFQDNSAQRDIMVYRSQSIHLALSYLSTRVTQHKTKPRISLLQFATLLYFTVHGNIHCFFPLSLLQFPVIHQAKYSIEPINTNTAKKSDAWLSFQSSFLLDLLTAGSQVLKQADETFNSV